MISDTEFIKLRQKVMDNDQALKEINFTNKLPQLLEVLGEPSEKLRDEIGWSTLSSYFRSSLCPIEVRIPILELLISDKFLFFNIELGETNDSVKRSFTNLIIADILIGDLNNGNQLSSKIISQVAQKLCTYLKLEKDWRGYDQTLGWVHTLAHSADAFLALAEHPSNTQNTLIEILNSIINYIEKRGSAPFMWQEDFRLGRAVSSLFENIPESDGNLIIKKKYPRQDLFKMSALQNILTTFRCIYLELYWNNSKKINLMTSIRELIV